MTALLASGITDNSLQYLLQTAKGNGITRRGIAEVLTHLAFYADRPKAWATFRMAKEIWTDELMEVEDGLPQAGPDRPERQ